MSPERPRVEHNQLIEGSGARDITAAQEIGAELAAWGKVTLLETRGRQSGNAVRTAVGFVEEPDGSLLIAAGEADADWALNLRANPVCRATIGDLTTSYAATELDDSGQASTVVRLILKYGTPAERLGRGPAFRLVPYTRATPGDE
jgi:deazaflavin-dependent oxidoreductase (nitroreductase family)